MPGRRDGGRATKRPSILNFMCAKKAVAADRVRDKSPGKKAMKPSGSMVKAVTLARTTGCQNVVRRFKGRFFSKSSVAKEKKFYN